MAFNSKLIVEFVDGRVWMLDEPLSYTTRRGDEIVVPAFFTTDFASIPRPLRTLVGDPSGPWAPAAVVHDFLYQTGIVSRREADRTFYEAMIDLDRTAAVSIRRSKAFLMWAAVRLGGWLAYDPPVQTT